MSNAILHRIRALSADEVLGASGGRVTVGGLEAYAADHAAAMRASLGPLIALISLGTFLALLVAFRAPLVALKAVMLNLVAALAAVGVVVLLFPGAAGGLPVTVPLLAFGAAFAVSIDWEVLLLFATKSALTRGNLATAVAAAVTDAGPLMVRGGVLLAVLFGAFASSSFVPLAMTGTALAAAVVLEITVVRLVLAPALLVLAGRWNWWPQKGGDQRSENGDRRVASPFSDL